ncbi:MAG: ATP-binding protein [Galactobacter sp.]
MPMSHLPVTDLTRNLVLTRSGTIWATWRLQALSYGYRSTKEKFQIKRAHEELFQAFRGEVMISALTATLDPTSVAEQMLTGVDLDSSPEWAAEVAETLDMLEDAQPGTRTFWLSVPLKAGGAAEWTRRQWEVLKHEISEPLGLPRVAPAPKVIRDALLKVERIHAQIPAKFNARPATPAEHVWAALHHQNRGLQIDEVVPSPSPDAAIVDDAFGHRGYPEPYVEPAGTDENGRNLPVYGRRWVKVVAEETPSYQVLQAISAMPQGGFEFPGGEWMAQADEMPFPVDWVWRMKVESAAKAKVANKKAENRYHAQMGERTDDDRMTGSADDLDETAANIAEMQSQLNRSAAEVKVATAVIFAVGASTADEARDNGRILKDAYKEMEVRLETPLGQQQEILWQQMHIGTPTAPIVTSLRHHTTGWNLAGAVPITNNALGGSTGMLLGWNISAGMPSPVLFDLEAQVMGNHSACFAISAELGAGKTFTLKRVEGDTIDRGGRAVAIDRSSTRELAQYGRSITDCVSIDIGTPEYSLDPLRMLGPVEGAPYVESLAAMLFNVRLTDDEGVVLAETLHPEYLAEHEVDSMSALLRHLLSSEDDVARKVGRSMRAIDSRKFGRVLFDEALPTMPLDSQGLVFCTHDLVLPTPEEISSEHLFSQLGPDKIFGRALYALIAKLAQRICFSSRSDLAGFFAPEAHHLTSNQQGIEIVNTFIKEGRKAKAFMGMDSHDPDEFGSSANLIPTRLVMRHTDKDMARKCLKWLNLDPTDDELAERIQNFAPLGSDGVTVMAGREGEGLMLDPFRNVGMLQVTPPARKERQIAISSTPEESRQVQEV